ncbi:MAG TPA: TIGR01459 family HAD-type hydrolase [Rhizomicrobium sp.]|nr:TIGR01459 family HAD-type hydrolase [Rhizomicrobium sp.]
MDDIRIISGLSDIAGEYDALVCDVWGVLHNGKEPFLAAADALRKFRADRGPVVLLSNAPRLVPTLMKQFETIGVPLDCFDAVVTSGVAARDDLLWRTRDKTLAMLHLGPERDCDVFEGLNVASVEADQAEIVLCTGLYHDDHETPDDYAELLAKLKEKELTMLCANPDQVVQRGGQLVYCAGALARAYEKIEGEVVYFGKPYPAIYDLALETMRRATRRTITRVLAVGDAMETDLKGANAIGFDVLFIAHGIHAAELGEMTTETLVQLFEKTGVNARAAMRELVW